ncbi:Glutathione transporter 1 [Cyphellophora attinorum]|uniref:Glutathione transporter 1 n=1 Tax=Cyphellophora attinorum TaxID=1664694 RepID=A0A0N1H3G1_9EURO|nr:Glutathione transporter 1 [Phialophora attinorum]KPI35392.1 Glutathione transporter 1 [Phialophora attinorum]
MNGAASPDHVQSPSSSTAPHTPRCSDLELEDYPSSPTQTHLLAEDAATQSRPRQRVSGSTPLSSAGDDSGAGPSTVVQNRPAGWLTKAWRTVMSRAPLLMRSSPALGTASYGAVPIHDLSDSEEDEPYLDEATATEEDDAIHPVESSPDEHGRRINPRHGPSSSNRRRRRSSMTSEVTMGPDAKTSFGFAPPIHEHKAESSNASLRTHNESSEDEWNDENPPDNSVYPEVRASVLPTDNTTVSINTPRMWILSLLFAIAGSATNLFFSLRYPSVAITPVIALVLVHPLGKLWDLLLKRKSDPGILFADGDAQERTTGNGDTTWATRLRLWLAQGRWNEKEHACVYISSNVSFGFAFATDVIVEQHKFYKQEVPILYQLLLTLSTQILGYAFAGLTRRFLVRPAAMIWPGTLGSTAMFTTMHKNENKVANGWTVSRYRFFVYVWAAAFAWYFLPGLLMPALSYFNVITWFAPKNVVVSNLFGVASGLGMFPLTFDWAQIAYIGSPLLTPWWAAANVIAGMAVVMWILAPLLYYANVMYSGYMPIISASVFDNNGKIYKVSKILTPDFIFDKDAYESYSRVYLPITYVLSYAVQFAALAALVTHTACWHGSEILRQSKDAFHEREEKQDRTGYVPVSQSAEYNGRRCDAARKSGFDVHNRLMERYPDVPMVWYGITFIVMLAIGICVVEYYPVHLPWYGLILAVSITAVLFIPVGIVMAITNQHSSLYLICQLICGVVFPGRPVANMVFVTYCYISSAQGIKFSSDMKLGHYMKIPPKLLFKVQFVATIVASLVQIGVLNWMFINIPHICTPEAINGFNCPIARVHFNGSILWGVVGPQRFFGPGALYRPLVWAFLVGLLAPIVVWLIGRNSDKKSVWRKINLPVLFGSLSWIPPATGLNFSIWAIVCFLFNSLARRRAPAWWSKYTMTMSAALDSGLAFGLVVVFFGFIYPGWGWVANLKWWGTEIYKQGCDWQACPYLKLGPGEKFGA